MIVPVILTGGILALLYRTRQAPPVVVQPAPTTTTGPQLDLPLSPSGTAQNAQAVQTFASLPPELQDQANALLRMGEAAAPADLRALANRIAAVVPGSRTITVLRTRAEQNLALGGTTRSGSRNMGNTVRGLPGHANFYDLLGQIDAAAEQFRPFSYVDPTADQRPMYPTPYPVQDAPNNVQTASVAVAPPTSGADLFRCVEPEGCPLFRTPSSLYPIPGTNVPGGATIAALQRSGDFLEVRYQDARGWMPLRALASNNRQPAADSRPAYSGQNFYR